MSYAKLAANAAKKAFNQIGDLASVVTLSSKAVTGFDFSTGEKTGNTVSSKTIKGLLNWTKRQQTQRTSSEVGNTRQAEFIFLAADVSDPTVYDTITMSDGSVWTIVPPYSNDGILITVNVAKEA